jgi:antirestriction protein ArdC
MGFDSEWWLTYRQAQSMSGHVCEGEKGTPACFWKIVDDPRCPACRRESARHSRECRRRVILNTFTAFNLEQIDGIEYPKTERSERPPFEAIEAAEAIAKGYVSMWGREREEVETGWQSSDGPSVHERRSESGRAYYQPLVDQIHLPAREGFHTPEEFYSTLFHELAHSSGHESRLDRKFGGRFGDHAYTREELVAEMTASYLSGVAGIVDETLDNSTAYLQGWAEQLRKNTRWVVVAASQAEKAADWIRGLRPETGPPSGSRTL